MEHPDGRLFALLQLKLAGKAPAGLSEADQEKLAALEKKLKSPATAQFWKKVAGGLPNRECRIENGFFSREDIVLGLMFLGFDDSTDDRDRYYRHMNACYSCFEVVGDIMRGYLSELEKHKNR